ncbi:hypothetical protein M407DRAFT_34526 [Tulasnella calospora MUT 4182]|uniref:Uncharacterized protein n=1 Tax=Tulasnella calospora MUT 4182 TaxID=1051891 RepID=A0A0C3L2E0_9AGAM|nr:hypothetical protein M407DRAFT_34526 [Tulasnella calospora MUT 4182]
MSTTDTTEQKISSAQAVDEEYEKLERFHVNCRRIVLVGDKDPPEGGFGVVRRAELYHGRQTDQNNEDVQYAEGETSVHEGNVGVVESRGASWDRQVSRLLRRL